MRNFKVVGYTFTEKFDSMWSETALRRFLRVNFRPEAASDVISGVVAEEVSLGVEAKFGDSSLNSS